MHDPPLDQVTEWGEESDHYIDLLEQACSHPFPPGRAEDLPFMRLTLDAVHVTSRPLLWYLIVLGIDTVTHLSLRFAGLHHYPTRGLFRSFPPQPLTLFTRCRSPSPNLSYWYRPHRSPNKDPIVLMHGIGIGLFAYISLLRDIVRADPDRGLVVVEILPVSMRIMLPFSRPLFSPRAFCEDLITILEHHSFIYPPSVTAYSSTHTNSITIIGHSFGTFLAGHILRHPAFSHSFSPSLPPSPLSASATSVISISKLILLDPIPFLLFHPALVHNFVYRVPGAWKANEWMIWYFTSRDVSVAALLARGFFWAGGVMWKEDILPDGDAEVGDVLAKKTDMKTLVVLAGRDQIIATPLVWSYLTNGAALELPDSGSIASSSATQTAGLLSSFNDGESIQWVDHSTDPTEVGPGPSAQHQPTLKVVMHHGLDHAQLLLSRKSYGVVVDLLQADD
ncbi:hypothetical protein DL93DRAFT_1365536 [Clavulina sp. PMI_390]|nr:hypothetical protein DL93DRAFT_1365536 [Clavulina sp. PMI_390]